MVETVRVEGLKEIVQTLKTLPPKLQVSIARKALRNGANLLAKSVKQFAPRKSGALKRNVKIKNRTSRSDNGRSVFSVVVDHGKVQRLTASTGKHHSGRDRKGKARLRNASARQKRGEDPFYWYFQEFGYHATGSRRVKGAGRKGRKKTAKAARFIRPKHFATRAFQLHAARVPTEVANTLSNEINKL